MTDTAADRARLAEIEANAEAALYSVSNEQWGEKQVRESALSRLRDDDLDWLYEKVRDGIAAREALARVEAWADDEDRHFGSCRIFRPYRTADGPPSCDCGMRDLRRVITGEA